MTISEDSRASIQVLAESKFRKQVITFQVTVGFKINDVAAVVAWQDVAFKRKVDFCSKPLLSSGAAEFRILL
ncbi:MAG: hypothetical protein KGJ32_01100 [Xanthomonadaceae bacterium]|nr:hypothetical protein [Xanthomonadaceae bacterium]